MQIPSHKPGENHPAATLELKVNNHPGVMSHICGLFARRAFNLEAIVVLPEETGATSRMWLLVKEDDRLDQVQSQVEKLHDVIHIKKHGPEEAMFEKISAMLACPMA
jgi:acetolactate synthase-1/3 small subunit